MKKLVMVLGIATCFFAGCEDGPGFPGPGQGGHSAYYTKKFSSEVAVTWINMQQHLTKTTPGFDPLVASRAFAYSGLTLYESVVKGMPGYRSIMPQQTYADFGLHKHKLYWPASANAAMAYMLKNLYANTSDANKAKIDSLESAFNETYQQEVKDHVLAASVEFGRNIATQIFEWSKTDGGHEAYKSAINDDYVPPTGPGRWVPTPTAFSKPVRPYWGNNRSFIPNIAASTLPGPPLPYSESAASPFYDAVNEVYTISQSLTEEEKTIAKTWADLTGNYGTPAHYTNIATQLIVNSGAKLDKAVLTYVKHGIALNDAMICVFKAKYTYSLLRPVTYIHGVMGDTMWSTVVGIPPHPEYPSAHATLGGASYTVLENIFGRNTPIVDRTHEDLWGTLSYPTIKAYAEEASWSRVLAGIHYRFSAETGLDQGAQVGKKVNMLPFKGYNYP